MKQTVDMWHKATKGFRVISGPKTLTALEWDKNRVVPSNITLIGEVVGAVEIHVVSIEDQTNLELRGLPEGIYLIEGYIKGLETETEEIWFHAYFSPHAQDGYMGGVAVPKRIKETDDELRDRLCLLPKVNHYWAEDIGNASGDDLDAIAKELGTYRYLLLNEPAMKIHMENIRRQTDELEEARIAALKNK